MNTAETDGQTRTNWRRLLSGFFLTGILAWGVHSVLLEVCKVPYPAQLPSAGIVPFLNYAASALAILILCRLAAPRVSTLRPWRKCLGLGVLLVMLNETLRVMFIVGVITTAWTHSFVDYSQGAIAPFLLGVLVALVAPRTTRWWQQAAAAFLIAAVIFFGVRPLVTAGFRPLLAAVAHLDHERIYSDTSWQLNAAAGLGFIEPALASFVLVALVWPRLSGRPGWRALQFALLLTVGRRNFFAAFYYPFFASSLSAPMAMLSAGQFTLEWLTLGLLTAATWHLSRSDPGNPSPTIGKAE